MVALWRLNDTVRRRAIHNYIRMHREELLPLIPNIEALTDKNMKRNELVRLGRIRFNALPSDVQARFGALACGDSRCSGTGSTVDNTEAGMQHTQPASRCSGGSGEGTSENTEAGMQQTQPASRCSGEGIRENTDAGMQQTHPASRCSGKGSRENTEAGMQQTHPASRCSGEGSRENTEGRMRQTQSAHTLGGDGHAVTLKVDSDATRRSSPPAHALQHDRRSPVKNIIMDEFAFLQKTFPGPAVFDVLASAFRMLDRVSDDMPMETDRVKAAVCLGIGAKLAHSGPSHTFVIWNKFTKPRCMPYLKSVEVRVLNSWAKKGL